MTSSTLRKRKTFPQNLNHKTVALLDIAKERSDEFLDHIETKFTESIAVKRYRKASNSKNADLKIYNPLFMKQILWSKVLLIEDRAHRAVCII